MAIRRSVALLFVAAAAACRTPPAPSPLVPQTSGTIAVAGLQSPVRVVRDRWGVPHIYAASQADLFFAQGFVQAEDRLFQMDLWRRASQGRLAEILGANFAERDTMTRRVQYHGDRSAEWASYGPDAEGIASVFVRGINAWVSFARMRPPEEFVLAGWPPSYWFADDLLNRTDAFVASGDAIDEVRRAGYPDVVADALRLVGTPPFLVGAGPPDAATRTRDGYRLTAPSLRYLVHLVAPGWNVVGVTAPWLPGVAVGHNDRVSWNASPIDVDVQDLFVDRLDRTPLSSTADFIRIKGRPRGMAFVRETTPHGVVIATDRERNRVFTIQWTGFDPGGAAELGALAIDRATSAAEFRTALSHWKLPARRFTFTDRSGGSGTQDVAGTTPRSRAAGTRQLDVRSPASSRQRPARDVVFAHVLGIGNRQRFNVGPVPRPADDRQTRIDRSRAINAPGQSGWIGSAHYADMAKMWSAGEMFELWFGEDDVRANAEATLTLTPRP